MSLQFKAFVRDNLVLIAGLSLPALLILLFLASRSLPLSMVPDPQYKAVYTFQPWNDGQRFSFEIDDEGMLKAEYLAPKTQNSLPPLKQAKLFIFDGATAKTETITLKKPDIAEGKTSAPVAIPALQNYKFSHEDTAPDGYVFQRAGYRNSSLITEIFSTRNHSVENSLKKDSRTIPLSSPPDQTSSYGTVEFIGWIIEDAKQ